MVSLTEAISQPKFTTVVPAGPVTEGESFTIQYIWQDPESISNFRVESFNGLKVVNGPISYKAAIPSAKGASQMQNFLFTVLATSKGILNAPQALATYKGRTIRSSAATLNIVSARQALVYSRKEKLEEGYFLKSGEDPYKKINENLFVRMTVDRRTCYVGEPIVATYKLYSRLESRSDIIRNPGFYGFAVHDIVSLSDRVKTEEIVDGKDFDVHLLRKVQLYPLQAGDLTIDAIEIKNRVRFSASGKREQEVAEGLLNSGAEEPVTINEFESMVSNIPVIIKVKPLTEKNRPDSFSGAVGKFQISARVLKNSLAKNEAGILELKISGKGNFIQLTAPGIQWPQNIEGFEAVLMDSLKKQSVPLEGSRMFRYSFVSSKNGDYVLPPVSFSYFDPDSGKYRMLQTIPVSVTILDKELVVTRPSPLANNGSKKVYWWLLLLILPLVYVLVRKNRLFAEQFHKEEIVSKKKGIDELFSRGKELLHIPGSAIFIFIRDKTLEYIEQEFQFSGSASNKDELARLLMAEGIDKDLITELLALLSDGETVIYTGVLPDYSATSFFEKSLIVLKKLEARHSAYL